ncbi:hypothetical protein BKA66DRAFT_513694 [Pyrenochaeta sp. MPI-SDFR-AT-0127]|nr:hypothetical protein BKA66DRAFT_513694 [Pyrenochaeta sp. MPI-SDFR-AT-0127]
MAANVYDIVVLSSSPPEPSTNAPPCVPIPRRVAMSAPPPLNVSPPVIRKISVADASTTNLRAAPIPDGAVRGFATVGSLIRSEHFANQIDNNIAQIQRPKSPQESLEDIGRESAAKREPRKRATKTNTVDKSKCSNPRPKARRPKADKANATDDPDLRLPAPTKSHFFAAESSELCIDNLNELSEIAPKLTKSRKPRKSRPTQQNVDSGAASVETRPKRTRSEKPKGAAKAGKQQRADEPVVSVHFQGNADNGNHFTTIGQESPGREERGITGAEDTPIWEVPSSPQPKKRPPSKRRPQTSIDECLDLEEAVARRRDWTPPPEDTTPQTPLTNSAGKENHHVVPDATCNFSHLLSNFAYAQPPSVQSTTRINHTEILAVAKRRRIELVEVPSNQPTSNNSSPEKGKAPKKKARTITDLVTEKYAPRDAISNAHAANNNFSHPQNIVEKVPLNDVETNSHTHPKAAPRKHSTSKPRSAKKDSKAKSKKASAEASNPLPEKLLSPVSAVTRMNRQEILFGTSSQLALEDSPTMVRQLQLAIKESEGDADALPDDDVLKTEQLRWPKLRKIQGRRALWAASARDDAGNMLEHIENVYIPEPDRTQDPPLLMDGTHDRPARQSVLMDNDELNPPSAVLISSDLPTPPCTMSQGSETNKHTDYGCLHDSTFDDIDDFEQEPPPSNQNVSSQNRFLDINDFSLPPSGQMKRFPPRALRPPAAGHSEGSSPNRIGRSTKPPSTVSLEGIPSKATHKPLESKITVADTIFQPPSTPLQPTKRFIDIEEILDSEDEALEVFSPTPPRIRRLQEQDPLPLVSFDGSLIQSPIKNSRISSVTSVDRIPTTNLQWNHIREQTFEKITAYIRSLPPTTDPQNPSWHEKILMYDPIIIEDFTSYLNTHTSIRTFKRATQKQIKSWNQVLKTNGDAALSVDESGEEVLAIRKELEAYMVQGWCESLGVCCIWGEGRGKGGVRKGLY